jgi:hypothetical protein
VDEPFFGTYKGQVTALPDKVSGRPFTVDDDTTIYEPCYVDHWGRSHCGHEHAVAAVPLQDIYRLTPGWTAQLA